MAGLGTRFSQAGYQTAKPLLPVHGVPVYQVVLANLLHPDVASVTLISQKSWSLRDAVLAMDAVLDQTVTLIEIDYTTGGPAETVELARSILDPSLPVVTANSDQYLDANLGAFYDSLKDPRQAGTILTMEDDDPKWSYVRIGQDGYVECVREKEVISPHATVGIYGFSSAQLMFRAFDAMHSALDTTNGEYYVGPSYNQLIAEGLRVGAIGLGPISSVMHGLGIPIDYERFLANPISSRGAAAAMSLFSREHQ